MNINKSWNWYWNTPIKEMFPIFFRGNQMIKPDEEIDIFDEDTPFMYIFVRNDLPAVVKLIQVAHATHEAGIEFGKDNFLLPIHFCVFGVKNEDKLKSIAWDLTQGKLNFHMFYEPDLDIGNTAIAVEPLIGEEREWFQGFKLLKM